MKLFFISFIFFALLFSAKSIAQDTLNLEGFEHNDSHLFCGSDNAKALRGKENTPILKSLPTPLDPSAYIICGNGKFRIIFMDIVNDTGFGFDQSALGPQRRNCVCEVVNYLESVISIPANIGTTSPTIDIIFNLSTNNAIGNPLAVASPVFPPEFYNATGPFPVPGYYGGYLYDYITTGVKPDVNSEEAQITVDFQNQYSYCLSTVPDCQLDFYSIILHEFTHALGFISFGKEVSGVLSSKISANVFSKLDEHYLYYNNSGVFLKMFDVVAFSGTNGVNPLLPLNAGTNNNVWLTNSNLINKQNQPINSVTPYSSGTSLSHLDDRYHWTSTGQGRTNISPGYSPNYLMNGSINYHQKKRVITLEEIEILQTIGYTINPTFPQLTNISNKTPYHQGNLITPNWYNAGAYFNSTPASGLSDLTISTSNGIPVTLNLTTGIMTNGTILSP